MEKWKAQCVFITHNIFIRLFFITAAVVWTLGLQTSNVFVVPLTIILWFFLKSDRIQTIRQGQEKTEKIVVNLIAGVFAAFWVMGNYDVYQEKGIFLIIQYAVSMLGIYLLLRECIGILVYKLSRCNLRSADIQKISPFRFGICVFFICILCWLPYFLAYYPGIITDDAEWQLEQAIGLRSFSNHQPWIHTMFHRLFYKIGYYLFHTVNAGVAVCVVVQMGVMAAAFAYLITTFYREHMKRGFLYGCVIYFALIPFHALYAVTLWKDVAMGAVVLCFSVSVWRMTGERKVGIGTSLIFLIMGLLLCILRSNGFYAYLLCVPFFLLFLKRNRRSILLFSVMTIALTLFYKGPVLKYYGVTPPDTIESLSIPAQHIARVIADDGTLSEKQEKLLSKAVDVSQIKKEYDPALSDPIKTLVRQTGNQEYIAEHKIDYFKLWIELGIEHPSTYLKAQIDQTKGYWYPDIQYWVTTTMMKENSWGMYRDSKMPGCVLNIMRFVETLYKQIPILGLLWSIGFYTWTMILLAGVTICRKKSIAPFFPVAAILLSLFIATPVQAEFRYSYTMMTTIPLFIMIACSEEKRQDEENSSIDTMLQ